MATISLTSKQSSTRKGRPLDPTASIIGEYIRQQRYDRHLPLAAVASLVGISVPYLSDIERGKKHPPVSMWKTIGAAVGCDPELLKRKYRLEAARRASNAWEQDSG